MWGAFSYCCLSLASAAVFRGPVNSRQATHDLTWENGQLSFMQMQSETHLGMRESALYTVYVNLDIELLQPAHGLSVIFDKASHSLSLIAGRMTHGIAWGTFNDQIFSNGWSHLEIETTTHTEISNEVRMYAAGYIEGIATCVRLSEYFHNSDELIFRSERVKHSMSGIKSLLQDQLAYWKAKSNLIPNIMPQQPKEDYWKHARYTLFQLWGMADGYNYAAYHFGVKSLDLIDFLMLNSAGDIGGIIDAYTPKAMQDRAAFHAEKSEALKSVLARKTVPKKTSFLATRERSPLSMLQQEQTQRSAHHPPPVQTRKEGNVTLAHDQAATNTSQEDVLDDAHWRRKLAEDGHCSALVRLTKENKDILIGHTTWNDYSKMTRIFKYYDFAFFNAPTMAKKIGFSSYPGLISSTDNFYVMDSGLQVMDTTLVNLNPFLLDKVSDFPGNPHIPNFAHLMITNRMAKSGAHWAQLFETQNTGTMNSQWMIVDYNRFEPGKQVPDDTFWVLETVPGLVHGEDMSFKLREQGYWPSFNRPYFDDVREKTGFILAQNTRGAQYSYLNNPRAKIFRSLIDAQNSQLEMRQLMEHNLFHGYPSDPGHDISARNDLYINSPIPNGGIDTKITSSCLAKRLEVQARSGPATNALVPHFRWASQWNDHEGFQHYIDLFPGYPHAGLPTDWAFPFVQMSPFGISGQIFDMEAC